MRHHNPGIPPGLRRLLTVIAALLLLPLLARPATAEEPTLLHLTAALHEASVADVSEYLVDREGKLTLQQLLKGSSEHKWQPVAGTSWSFGLSDSTYWFRFNLINRDAPEADNFLELHYPLLDHIDLYVVQNDRVIDQAVAGDALPFSQRPFDFRNFLFKPRLPRDQLVSIYVRVKTEGSLLAPIMLWHANDFYSHEQREVIIYGLYFGILLTFAFYNALLFGFTREKVYFYVTLYITSFGLFQAALFGLGYQYLWPELPQLQQYSIPLFMLIAIFAALRFANTFLPLQRYCPTGGPLLRLVTLFPPLVIVLLPVIPYSLAVKLSLLLTLLGAALLLPASFVVWWRARGETGYFFFAWFIFLASVIVSAADKLGAGRVGVITDYVMQLGVIVQIAAFTLALARRMNQEKQQRIEAQQQNTIKLEKMVNERTAELEQANRRLDAISHTDGLTGLKNRRLFDEELERQFREAIREHKTISLAMIDIDHFKRLNDTYGHQVGDDFLRLIAAEISAEIKRPMDSACRYGGEEFALILPDTPLEGVQQIAECIRSAIESLHHRVGNERVPVTISIGTATLSPEDGDTPDKLILLADKALYRAKGLGRNRVISC